MRKIFLFLFAAVLSIGTAMAEVVTITGDDCALEYTVEDDRALIITGTYLEQHSFELTLIGEIDLNAESFDCDMQMMKIGEYGSVAWADEGTATVTIYPAAIEITATGLFDSAGDDQNTYNLEGVLAFPKSSAGGDDIAVDNEFFVDMPSLTVTMDEILAFEATGQETGMPLGTVVTYLQCDWFGEDGAYPVIPGASTLNLPDAGLFGEVLAGSVVPVMDPSTYTVVSATATVYVAFEDMGTFKFTLNMTAGSSEEPGEPGEPEESATVSVQVWNATLSQQYGTLMLDGSMNGVAVHAEVPGFEFVPDTWDWFEYSNVMVEVGTWVEEGESDYVGLAYGDATVELDQNTVTITGTMTASDGTSFVAYIQGSLQPATPMPSTTLNMDGLMKTEGGRYIELADENNNTIEIWGSGYSDYLKVTASFDETLEGYGSWKEVAGVETLVATLYDDYYTHVYYVTATASAQQMFTINSFDATYFIDPEFGEVTFRGIAEEGGEFEITVGENVEGQFAQGYWGETEIAATAITYFELDFMDDTYYLGGTFQDAESNIYEVWVVAAPLPVYTRTVTSGNYGTICLPFGSTNYTGATFYEFVGSETGKVYLGSVTELEAGVPYIFQATATELAVYSDGTSAATPGDNNGLYGTFDDEVVVANGNYILYQNQLRPSDGTAKVKDHRAYVVLSEVPSGAPTQMPGRKYINMSVNSENEATGLENINGANEFVKMIENGQLIIIRGNEMYNAQGVRF